MKLKFSLALLPRLRGLFVYRKLIFPYFCFWFLIIFMELHFGSVLWSPTEYLTTRSGCLGCCCLRGYHGGHGVAVGIST